MIDEFVRAMYAHEQQDQEAMKLAEAMELLPAEDLKKIAHYGLMSDDGAPWIDRYIGTPLFDQASQLEQQMLQLEQQRDEENARRREMWDNSDSVNASLDTIRVQRRMLDVQLSAYRNEQLHAQQAAEADAVAAMQQPAEPIVPEEVVKQAAANMRARLLEKQALSLGSLKNVGSAIKGIAKSHPRALMGAGIGAAGGGIVGAASGDEFSLRRTLGGAALGAGLGAAAGHGLSAAGSKAVGAAAKSPGVAAKAEQAVAKPVASGVVRNTAATKSDVARVRALQAGRRPVAALPPHVASVRTTPYAGPAHGVFYGGVGMKPMEVWPPSGL